MKSYVAMFEQFETELDKFFENNTDMGDDEIEDDLIFSQTDNVPDNGVLSKPKKVDEISKSDHFRQRTSTPYTGGADRMSRFVPFEQGSFESGWVLDGMQKVNDQTGKPMGEVISIEKFSKEHVTSSKTIQTAITVALGELANLPWIDSLNAPLGKRYLQIYMGKFGLEFKGTIYSPVFRLPYENNKYGDSFWLAASESRTDSGKVEVVAKTVLIRPSTSTDEEIERDAWLSANSAISKRNNDKFKEAFRRGEHYEKMPMIDERRFKATSAVIRETGATKTFFVIFKYGHSEKDIIDSAKRAITGQAVLSTTEPHRGKPNDPIDRERAEHEAYFNLDRGAFLSYFSADPNNKKLTPNEWNKLTVVTHEKPKTNERSFKVTVKNEKGESFILQISPNDKVKVIRNGGLKTFSIGVTDTSIAANKSRIKLVDQK